MVFVEFEGGFSLCEVLVIGSFVMLFVVDIFVDGVVVVWIGVLFFLILLWFWFG